MVMHYWHGNAKRPNLPAQSLALPCGTQPTHRGPVLRTRRRVVMETRVFGRTGMKLSVLGFGCGAVGGLMVRGDPRDQERTIVRAIDAGVNYFDTAVQYGDGKSEKNLGSVLQKLKPASVVVGTKVRLRSEDFGRISNAVTKSLEGSLSRLRLERVDIFHLHNAITVAGGGEALSVRQVRPEDALAAVQKGPLAAAALDRLTVLQQGFVGEPR